MPPTTAVQRLRTSGRLPANITERELAVMKLYAKGLTYEQIGEQLEISAATAGNHMRHIRMKLHCVNSVQAAVKLARVDLI